MARLPTALAWLLVLSGCSLDLDPGRLGGGRVDAGQGDDGGDAASVDAAPCEPGDEDFRQPGVHFFDVPASCTTVTAALWGAGGGAGGRTSTGIGRPGGGGAFVQASIAVLGGQRLEVMVGRGGRGGVFPVVGSGSCGGSGAGGDASAVLLDSHPLLVAGGGGGGVGWHGHSLPGTSPSHGRPSFELGNGVLSNGENGDCGSRGCTAEGGVPGTLSAGAGGQGGGGSGGGGGGGGAPGGAAGTAGACQEDPPYSAGGSGGTSYISAEIRGGVHEPGGGHFPGNSEDAGGAGTGATGTLDHPSHGEHGRVRLSWE